MFVEYYGKKLSGPPWPGILSPRDSRVISLADGSVFFADPLSIVFTRNRWKNVNDLLGEHVLVSSLSYLSVIATHLDETGSAPVMYQRPIDKYVKVTEVTDLGFHISPIGWVASPADGGPAPWTDSPPYTPGGPGHVGLGDPQPPGSDCLCVLSDINCGTKLLLPVYVSFV